MKRNKIKLNESQLQQVIKESVKRVLKESDESYNLEVQILTACNDLKKALLTAVEFISNEGINDEGQIRKDGDDAVNIINEVVGKITKYL